MRINKNEAILPVDIDGTLITHIHKPIYYTDDCLAVVDPLDSTKVIYVEANHAMIRLLKEEHHRGACIKVWSRGGWEWAQNVIKALELEQYVDEIMSKPRSYFDDLPIEKWLTDRVFIRPGVPYKNKV